MSLDFKEEEANGSCLLTNKQIAAKLVISLSKLHSWKRQGLIPFITIGGIVRFEFPRVLEALRAFETPASSKRVKPVKLGIHRSGLSARGEHGRILPRDAVTPKPTEGEA
jgi:hypothetical protein